MMQRGDHGSMRVVGYDFPVIVVNAAEDSQPSSVLTVVL